MGIWLVIEKTAVRLEEPGGFFYFIRKMRPIEQNPPGDAHYAQRKMAAAAAALRRESPASRILYYAQPHASQKERSYL